jgi:hypothetical protein
MEGQGWIGFDERNVLTKLYLLYMGWFFKGKNVLERAIERFDLKQWCYGRVLLYIGRMDV